MIRRYLALLQSPPVVLAVALAAASWGAGKLLQMANDAGQQVAEQQTALDQLGRLYEQTHARYVQLGEGRRDLLREVNALRATLVKLRGGAGDPDEGPSSETIERVHEGLSKL